MLGKTKPDEEPTMTLYCGIDLHCNNSVVVIIDEEDKVIFNKRLPNDLESIQATLQPYQGELAGCVVESTYNWYWLVDGLIDAGFSLHLANTAAITQYEGIKHTNDSTDAFHLAHLLRLDILPEGYIYPCHERGVRDLLRRRLLLVRQQTMLHLSTQGMITRHTGKRLTCNQVKQLNNESIHELLPDPCIALAAQTNLEMMVVLSQNIERMEKAVYQKCKNQADFQLLTTVPGIGKILGMTISLETGDIARFKAVGNYTSYARCVNSSKISNGKNKGHGNRKNGNRYLSWAFIEATHFATMWSPEIKRYYQRKLSKSHLMVARKTVANKLARACYHMLKQKVPFDINRAFG